MLDFLNLGLLELGQEQLSEIDVEKSGIHFDGLVHEGERERRCHVVKEVIIEDETVAIEVDVTMGWASVGFGRDCDCSLSNGTCMMEHTNVSRILVEVERIVAVNKEILIGMELAVIHPHSLRSEPIRVIGHSVEQVLVAVAITEC